ncbi:MAG: NAD(P)H-hydrate epimerase [Qingshengfaniella sp.]
MKTWHPGDAGNVITAVEMRALEAAAMASRRVSGAVLMGRAAAGCVAAMGAARPDLADRPGRAVVLCGPGNNGGDGYGIAALLAAAGWDVAVFALGDPAALGEDARIYRDRWAALGPVGSLPEAIPVLAGADLVVDALFGIGLARPLSDGIGAVLAAVPPGAFRVAVDVPSGCATDTGAVLGTHRFAADLTVTFHAPKPVHGWLVDQGAAVMIADIGL